jgi:ectoine hydroxylase-related dioxygenase (phytanoyl-CoA dioxygenase family)
MLSTAQIDQFNTRGFCVIDRAMSPQHLADVRAAADKLVDASLSGAPYPPSYLREGETYGAINKSTRLFFSNRCEHFPEFERFVKGELVAAIARDLLGPDVFLFNEQVVVKAPQHGDSFAWHQDSGYVRFKHRAFLTLWCALDDATRHNGTVYLIPRDLRKDTDVARHEWEEDGSNLVGYRGGEQGEIVEVAAGSIVAFSSLTMHRTGANNTDQPRRALVCQYSAEPLLRPETGRPQNRATPVPVRSAA